MISAVTRSHRLSRCALTRLLTITLGASLAASLRAGTDWPQFLGPNRDGTYPGKDLAADWPRGGPPVAWKREVGQGFAGPAVADGKLVLFHRVGDKETVECLDAKTGKPLWAADYPTGYKDDFGFDEGPRATPAVADGKAYTFGAEGMLNGWDLATGRHLWRVDTRAQFRPAKGFFGAACSPLVEGEAVILNVGGADGAGVVAFVRNTGKVRWKATDDAAGYASPVAATVGGRRVVLAFTRAALAAIDPGDGKVLFHFPWRSRMDASVNAATPLVIDDLVFLSATYGAGAVLLRLDPKDLTKQPQKVWSGDESLSNHYATSVHHDGFLYGYHGRQEDGPGLRCVELRTGKVRWSEDDFGAGTILLAGDRLLLLTEKGQLIQAPATPDGFKPAGKAQVLPFDTRAYPAVADGLLYARGKDKLVCADLRKAP
jgi:outer membrane protein assembly factor BamB